MAVSEGQSSAEHHENRNEFDSFELAANDSTIPAATDMSRRSFIGAVTAGFAVAGLSSQLSAAEPTKSEDPMSLSALYKQRPARAQALKYVKTGGRKEWRDDLIATERDPRADEKSDGSHIRDFDAENDLYMHMLKPKDYPLVTPSTFKEGDKEWTANGKIDPASGTQILIYRSKKGNDSGDPKDPNAADQWTEVMFNRTRKELDGGEDDQICIIRSRFLNARNSDEAIQTVERDLQRIGRRVVLRVADAGN